MLVGNLYWMVCRGGPVLPNVQNRVCVLWGFLDIGAIPYIYIV